MRKVVKSINCHTSKISEVVDYHLQPLVQETRSYVKDTNDFLWKIEELSNEIDDSTFLVTIDVLNPFTLTSQMMKEFVQQEHFCPEQVNPY